MLNNNSHRVPPYRRPIFIIAAALVLIAAVLFVILRSKSDQPSEPPANPAASSSNTSGSLSDPQDDKTPEAPEPPAQYEGGDPNLLDSLTGRFAYKNLNNGTLSAAVSIDQYLSEAGECVLSIRSGSTIIRSEKKPATADVTTSVCGPFSLAVGDLARGTYSLVVEITAGGKTGRIESNLEI